MGAIKIKLLVHEKDAKHPVEFFSVGDDVAIFLVQEYAMVLSTQMSNLGQDLCSVSSFLIESRTAVHESMIVECSMLLSVIRYEDLVLRYFRFLHTIESGYCTNCQKLVSGKHAPCPARRVSPRNRQSQSTYVT